MSLGAFFWSLVVIAKVGFRYVLGFGSGSHFELHAFHTFLWVDFTFSSNGEVRTFDPGGLVIFLLWGLGCEGVNKGCRYIASGEMWAAQFGMC